MASPILWPALKYPLVAILRGVTPDEVDAIGDVLVDVGFEAIEVPLNSPDPFTSIERLAKRFGDQCLIGAGTVLSADDCNRVADAGGRLMVSPNVDPEVLAAAVARTMVTLPGVLTPTEALLALRSGASALKFFPASVLGPAGISAILSILPKGTPIAAVGGVGNDTFADYVAVGIRIFGLGTSLYRPGRTAGEMRTVAAATIGAYERAIGA